MSSLHSLRARFVDSPDSIAERYRLRRWDMLRSAFPDIEDMAVIDLGGYLSAWERAPFRPARVHIVNLEDPTEDLPAWAEYDHANACDLPESIASRKYDLVFSNAVLEHVGGHSQRTAFAATVHSLSACHWIQTPYRYFPIEPHWLFPWFQNLPISTRVSVSRRWPLVHTPPVDREEALDAVMSVELISRIEMEHYFPSSQLVAERVGPLTKSLIAVRT